MRGFYWLLKSKPGAVFTFPYSTLCDPEATCDSVKRRLYESEAEYIISIGLGCPGDRDGVIRTAPPNNSSLVPEETGHFTISL